MLLNANQPHRVPPASLADTTNKYWGKKTTLEGRKARQLRKDLQRAMEKVVVVGGRGGDIAPLPRKKRAEEFQPSSDNYRTSKPRS